MMSDTTTILIPMAYGRIARIDAADAVTVVQRHWYAKKNRNVWYMASSGSPFVYLHQLLLPPKDGLVPDHINGDGLDNRRSNLRYGTRAQNQHNARPRGGLSGFKGVTRTGSTGAWRAQIRVNKQLVLLGTFATEVEAARAYDAAAAEHFGEFARTNLPLYDTIAAE